MRLNYIRQCMSRISLDPFKRGPELIFTTRIKDSLHSTNFEVLGEELLIKTRGGNITGQSGILLINKNKKFLLDLELKVGKSNDVTKRTELNNQVVIYTNAMQYYCFPDPITHTYGLGAYRCTDTSKIIFTDYVIDSSLYDHTEDILSLKKIIKESY